MLEEIATTVVRITKDGRSFRFAVVKSINNEIDGMEIKV
ncbi:DUF257 domain-containing protein [Thermococcus barophilus]|nr:DUF257 domain-containing protein [Thermococcus barophilus]